MTNASYICVEMRQMCKNEMSEYHVFVDMIPVCHRCVDMRHVTCVFPT